MNEIEKTQLKEDLHSSSPVTVIFTKSDGSTRVMRCTLHEDHIPADHIPKGTGQEILNDDVLRVFDVESVGWRSFRYDSVNSFYIG